MQTQETKWSKCPPFFGFHQHKGQKTFLCRSYLGWNLITHTLFLAFISSSITSYFFNFFTIFKEVLLTSEQEVASRSFSFLQVFQNTFKSPKLLWGLQYINNRILFDFLFNNSAPTYLKARFFYFSFSRLSSLRYWEALLCSFRIYPTAHTSC